MRQDSANYTNTTFSFPFFYLIKKGQAQFILSITQTLQKIKTVVVYPPCVAGAVLRNTASSQNQLFSFTFTICLAYLIFVNWICLWRKRIEYFGSPDFQHLRCLNDNTLGKSWYLQSATVKSDDVCISDLPYFRLYNFWKGWLQLHESCQVCKKNA